MAFNFFVKSNIEFGRGALEMLPQILQGYGMKSAMIVYDGGVKAAGIADEFLEDEEFERAWDEELDRTSDEEPESPVCVGRGTGKRDTGLPPLAMMVC